MASQSILWFFGYFHNFLDFEIHHKIIPFVTGLRQAHALSFIKFGLVFDGWFVGLLWLYFVW